MPVDLIFVYGALFSPEAILIAVLVQENAEADDDVDSQVTGNGHTRCLVA